MTVRENVLAVGGDGWVLLVAGDGWVLLGGDGGWDWESASQRVLGIATGGK